MCLNDTEAYILHISRSINNTSAPVIPDVLEDKLKKYNNVGTVVYCRPRSPKPPPDKYVTVTILQLIASEIILLSFDKTTRECTCRLAVVDAWPAYFTDLVWSRMCTIGSQ